MIASMTGFARSEASVPTGTLVCELRSVNHRFLEASLRLPEELRALEAGFRRTIGTAARRGKVDAALWMRPGTAPSRGLLVDESLIDRLLDASQANRVDGVIEDEIYMGDRTDWRVRAGGELLTVAEPAGPRPERVRGEAVSVSFAPDAVLRLS